MEVLEVDSSEEPTVQFTREAMDELLAAQGIIEPLELTAEDLEEVNTEVFSLDAPPLRAFSGEEVPETLLGSWFRVLRGWFAGE